MGNLTLKRIRRINSIFFGRAAGVIVSFVTTGSIIRKGVALNVVVSLACVVNRLDNPVNSFVNFTRRLRSTGVDLRHLGRVRKRGSRRRSVTSGLAILPRQHSVHVRGLSFDCSNTSHSCILGSIGLGVPRRGIATVINADNDNGAALVGLVLNFCAPGGKSVGVNRAPLSIMGPRL